MSEVKKKRRKKRVLAMTYKERIFMTKVANGLAKNKSIVTLAEAARQLGKDISFVRHAVLERHKGKVSAKIREDVLTMAGMKTEPKKTEQSTS
jgi:hypothetical protein